MKQVKTLFGWFFVLSPLVAGEILLCLFAPWQITMGVTIGIFFGASIVFGLHLLVDE